MFLQPQTIDALQDEDNPEKAIKPSGKYKKKETASGYVEHEDFMQGYQWLVNQAEKVTKQWSKL